MGWRFHKSFKIAPGLRINLSKTGVRLSTSIPGTGIRFLQDLITTKKTAGESISGDLSNEAASGLAGCFLILLIASAIAVGAYYVTAGSTNENGSNSSSPSTRSSDPVPDDASPALATDAPTENSHDQHALDNIGVAEREADERKIQELIEKIHVERLALAKANEEFVLAQEKKSVWDREQQEKFEKAEREKAELEKMEPAAQNKLRIAKEILLKRPNSVGAAKIFMRDVIKEFPKTEAAKEAEQLLRNLN